MKVSKEEIESKKTKAGGWTKDVLAEWGVPWPPPKGWKDSLIKGEQLAEQRFSTPALKARYSDSLEAHLLHLVVMEVIQTGHSEILAAIPELNDYYGSKMPTVEGVIGGRPQNAIIEGGIRYDDVVYRFSCIRATKQR